MLTIAIDKWSSARVWAKVIVGIDLTRKGAFALTGDDFLIQTTDGPADVTLRGKYDDFTLIALSMDFQGRRDHDRWCAVIETCAGVTDAIPGEFAQREQTDITGGRVRFFVSTKATDTNLDTVAAWGATNEQMKAARNPNYMAALYLKYQYWHADTTAASADVQAAERSAAIRFADPYAIEIGEIAELAPEPVRPRSKPVAQPSAERAAQLAADQALIAGLLAKKEFKNYSKIAEYLGVRPAQVIRVAHGQQCLRPLSRQRLAALQAEVTAENQR